MILFFMVSCKRCRQTSLLVSQQYTLGFKMSYTELEILYSPSKWSKRYPTDDVIPQHVKFAKDVSEKNKQNIPCQLNISYGERDKQKYDIFGTDLPDDSAIFIYIHGGYWQELDRDYSSYVVAPFYKNKIKSIVIGYTLCPKISLPEIINQIEEAIKNCLEYAKKCGSKAIYISGYSAGAQLIAILFEKFIPSLPEDEKQIIKAAVLCCGVYDLIPLVNTYINEPLKLTEESAKELSPLHQDVKELSCIVYVTVGSNDSPAFLKQSQLYYDKIKHLGNVQFSILNDLDHFSIVEKYNEDNYELVKFILELNKN